MIGDEFRHFKHGDLGFAAENGFEFVVSIDHAAVGRILQIVFFNVIPYLFGHFSARQRCCANDGRQVFRWRHGFHECCVWFAWCCRCCRFLRCCWLGCWFSCCCFGCGCCFLRCGRLGCCCFGWRCYWGFFGCCHLRASLTNTWEIAQLIARLILVWIYLVCKCFSRFHEEKAGKWRRCRPGAPLGDAERRFCP